MLSESFIRGQKKYEMLARFKLVSNFIFFLLFLLLQYYFQVMDFHLYFYSFFASQAIFIIMAFYKSGFQSFQFSKPVFKQIYIYGFFNMTNTLLLMIINSGELIMVNFFSPGRDVGVYSIYQGFVRNIFSIIFFDVFAVVFLPTIAGMD